MSRHNPVTRTLTGKYFQGQKLIASATQKIACAAAELETVSALPAVVSSPARRAAAEMMADLKELEGAFRRLRVAVVRAVPEPAERA